MGKNRRRVSLSDKNRRLQLAAIMAPILARIAALEAESFDEADVFRRGNEDKVVRPWFFSWLLSERVLEAVDGSFRILNREGIRARANSMRTNPAATMAEYLKSQRPARTGEEKVAGPVEPDAEVVEEEEVTEETMEEEKEEALPIPVDEALSEDPVPLTRPVSVTLKDLEALLLQANTRNKARYGLAAMAISTLLGAVELGDFKTRKELFYMVPSRTDRVVFNEGVAKSWQKAFLDNLEAAGYAEKSISGRDSVYRVADGRVTEVIVMLDDAVHGEGLALKKVLWPGQYEEPEEEEREAAPEAQQSGESGAVQVLSDLVSQLTSVAESMSAVSSSIVHVLDSLRQAEQRADERDKRQGEFFLAIKDQLGSLVQRLDDEERDAMVAIRDRLVETSVRRRSLSNQLESEGSREAKLLEELNVRIEKRGKK